jgi:hypothetical protein
MDRSTVRAFMENPCNVIIGQVQLTFFTFHINQVACRLNAGGIESHRPLKGRFRTQPRRFATASEGGLVVIKVTQSRPGRGVARIESNGTLE